MDNLSLLSAPTFAPLDLTDRKIVVIDDDQPFRILANYMLQRFGAEVTLFEKGIEAIEHINLSINQLASSPSVDAFVIDLLMPQMDGYAVAMRLRNMGYRGRIIAMTASPDEESRQLSTYAGFDELLAKPIDTDALLCAILGVESVK